MLARLLDLLRPRRSTFTAPPAQAPRIEPAVLTRASSPERHAIARGRGLWGDPRFPKDGWRCVGVEDLGQPNHICQACASARVRFVHLLTHPLHAGPPLVAGCVCAGFLIGDEAHADALDAMMRSRAAKRARWLSRRWRRGRHSGNAWLRADGFTITVYPARDGTWSATVSRECDAFVRHLHGAARSCDAAKLRAFDVVSTLLADEATQGRRRPPSRQ